MKLKKSIILFAILLLSTLVLSGCIYSHNYDENGNEMNREQVKETVDNIKESIQSEIKDALSSN